MSPAAAAKSRRDLLRETDHWFGAHIMFPGVVRIERRETESGAFKFSCKPE